MQLQSNPITSMHHDSKPNATHGTPRRDRRSLAEASCSSAALGGAGLEQPPPLPAPPFSPQHSSIVEHIPSQTDSSDSDGSQAGTLHSLVLLGAWGVAKPPPTSVVTTGLGIVVLHCFISVHCQALLCCVLRL